MDIEWTVELAAAFLELPTDESRLDFLLAEFGIERNSYDHDSAYTFFVDFELSSGLFCCEQEFSAAQTCFVCTCLSKLLSEAVTVPPDPPPNYDDLRVRLVGSLREMFKTGRNLFSFVQVQNILRHCAASLLQPLRLVHFTFHHLPAEERITEMRKIWQPPEPTPLDEFAAVTETEFERPPLKFATNPRQVRTLLDEYWDGLISVVGRRCAGLTQRIEMLKGIIGAADPE
jgi:hypothetical protein